MRCGTITSLAAARCLVHRLISGDQQLVGIRVIKVEFGDVDAQPRRSRGELLSSALLNTLDIFASKTLIPASTVHARWNDFRYH
ncbi:hypothetical protein ASE07_23340 [Noviherbaspirillum sp. Root189]|nr:hypothetical protein ASE07_23340 [Noviherbaspirillum sp. Root189]